MGRPQPSCCGDPAPPGPGAEPSPPPRAGHSSCVYFPSGVAPVSRGSGTLAGAEGAGPSGLLCLWVQLAWWLCAVAVYAREACESGLSGDRERTVSRRRMARPAEMRPHQGFSSAGHSLERNPFPCPHAPQHFLQFSSHLVRMAVPGHTGVPFLGHRSAGRGWRSESVSPSSPACPQERAPALQGPVRRAGPHCLVIRPEPG